MAHSSKVCILSDIETQELRRGIRPTCSQHRHTNVSDAFEQCRQGWQKAKSSYFHPIAEWVGPRHIRVLRAFSWAIVGQTKIGQRAVEAEGFSGPGMPRYGLVEAGR